MHDIHNLDDIKTLTDTFYSRVREDALLKDIFNNVIQDRWPEHLEKIHRFWQTVLLGERTYTGSPFLPHAKLPVDKEHFDRWLKLFSETVDEHFQGPMASRAKEQGEKMAEMFYSKIQFYRDHPGLTPLV